MSDDAVVDRALAPAARLLGTLLLRELDAELASELRRPAVHDALAALGITPPDADQLDRLAARWFELFLQPGSGMPPIASLWQEERYEGSATVAVRALAAQAGRALDAGARQAPPDHIGCILTLWADLIDERPDLAQQLQREHFAWAGRALRRASADVGFYGTVAHATVRLVQELAVASTA